MCLSVIVNPRQRGGREPLGLLHRGKKKVMNVMRQIFNSLKTKINVHITYSVRTQQTARFLTFDKDGSNRSLV